MQDTRRRDFYRLEASTTLDWVRLLNAKGTVLEAIEAQILDVSATGLRLHVREGVVTRGTRLAVRFRIGNALFATRGDIVWTEVSEFAKTQLAGVRFDENADMRKRLIRAIHDQLRDQLRRLGPGLKSVG